MPVEMKQGDQVETRWRAGIPINTATSLLFLASRSKGSPPVISKPATVDPLDTFVAEVTITTAESAAVGLLYVELQATYPDGQVITFPAGGYEELLIRSDLN